MIIYVATRDGPLFGQEYAEGQIIDSTGWDFKEIQALLAAGAITSRSVVATADGIVVPARTALEFSGSWVDLSDDPDNDATIVTIGPPDAAGLGLVANWLDGGVFKALTTTETILYSSVISYTFVSGRYYRFTLSSFGTPSVTNVDQAYLTVRQGTTVSANAIITAWKEQTNTTGIQFMKSEVFLAGTDFPSGASVLSVAGKSAAGTINVGSASAHVGVHLTLEDLGRLS